MLWCPTCKKNQDTIEVYRTPKVVTYQCVVCGTYIYVPVVRED